MKTTKAWRFAFVGVLLLAALPWLGGCASDPPAGGADAKPAESSKGSAQLWAENCSRCHNVRSPASYSDAQWEVVGMHMRVRGYLTGEEQRRIVDFLKSAN